MNIHPFIQRHAADFVALRRDLHAHPEIGFGEHRTAGIVAEKLRDWGIECSTGVGGTGVVGVLRGRREGPTIGLRADMDALPMQSRLNVPWASTVNGVFHGCGHDGHTTSLLMAAHCLASNVDLAGTVVFIFQPAEEALGGARAMLADGLFDRFPCDEIYGWHNWPDLKLGSLAVMPGPVMAGADFFDITLMGRGAHAAQPHLGLDVVPAISELVLALQTAVSRSVDPIEAAVLSVTRIQAGSAYNVLPETAALAGTLRYFNPEVAEILRQALHRTSNGVAAAHGLKAKVESRPFFGVTFNDAHMTERAKACAASVVSADRIIQTMRPSLGSEDFSDMLHVVPGAYLFIGHNGGVALHHPEYAFDDDVLPIAASVLVELVRSDRNPTPGKEK
ncbi:amidohydrolase [Devosia sp. 1566]|uniref:amidohydrolase n=1 Tax=Devosia sp. 1566 TaxID=2499144 RepID=UPI000FD72B0A|nr:amidohydrolase [Devosia sp. 1566]